MPKDSLIPFSIERTLSFISIIFLQVSAISVSLSAAPEESDSIFPKASATRASIFFCISSAEAMMFSTESAIFAEAFLVDSMDSFTSLVIAPDFVRVSEILGRRSLLVSIRLFITLRVETNTLQVESNISMSSVILFREFFMSPIT